ncbi:MAG: hypothetical protein CSA62_04355 [Planctomycetota bacterium]|nr:MAG: hypothetical protein CSA62_04355 [Planctomycetota bacterium]
MTYSRFYLCDLQLHTPGDPQQSYGDWGGRDPNPQFARKLIETCKEKGLAGFAVTDHNRVDWYPCLKEEGDANGVFVFPGVEVSVNRCHLLVIWDPTDDGFQLAKDFLSTCWEPGASRYARNGDPNPVTKGQVLDVALRALEHRGIVLAPHSTSKDMGFFGKGICTNRTKVIRKQVIAGFDVVGNKRHQVLRSPATDFGEQPTSWFVSGDTRSFESVGERACYFKMGPTPDLEGLRQAFLMPETRIRFPASLRDEWKDVSGVKFLEDPHPSWPRFSSVRIAGGFHNELNTSLAPGLNAIIGGKGTGKSALIEILRYGIESHPPASRDLVDNRKRNFSANAEVRIGVVDNEGQGYEAVRVGDESKAQLMYDGEDTNVDVGRRFQAKVFGQRELQQLGDESSILRDFVLSTCGEDWSKVANEELQLRADLLDHRTEIEQLEKVLQGMESTESDLADFREKLDQAKKSGADQLLVDAKSLNGDNLEARKAFEWPNRIEGLVEAVRQELPPPRAPLRDELPKEIEEVLEDLSQEVDSATQHLKKCVSNAQQRLAGMKTRWDNHVSAAQKTLAAALADVGVADGAELAKIQSRVTEMELSQKSLPEKRKEMNRLMEWRRQTLERVAEVGRKKSGLVEQAAKRLSERLAGRVRLIVRPLADRSPVVDWFKRALAGDNVASTQIGRIAEHPVGQIADAVLGGAQELMKLGCSSSTATKVVNKLDGSLLRELEELESHDAISAEVNLGSEETVVWRPVESVSPGQRATALLALVLLSGSEPLIIDQPEDDLDNQHIYEDVVSVLSDVCQSRQVIIATHNANIPVLGDAELVIALGADAERSYVEAVGGFENQKVAMHARRVLEGGEDAFDARQRRYRGG